MRWAMRCVVDWRKYTQLLLRQYKLATTWGTGIHLPSAKPRADLLV